MKLRRIVRSPRDDDDVDANGEIEVFRDDGSDLALDEIPGDGTAVFLANGDSDTGF